MSKLDFPVFDADNHLYESIEASTRHLPKELEGVIRYVNLEGRTKIVIKGFISEYIPNPTFEVVARPGSFGDFFSGNNPEGKTLRELAGEPMRAIPAFRNPEDRLALLDELGIDATLLFPTLASLIEVNFSDMPQETLAILHGFNQWLLEDWTFNYKDRVIPTPIVNPAILDQGIAELEWVLDNGAKAVLLRPGPVAGSPSTRSPFLPEFDPFWARVQESGVVVAMHASDSGYQRHINEWEGRSIEYSAFKPSTFQQAVMNGNRAIQDTFFSAVCHGMLTRFPEVKLVSVENGGSWVPQVLSSLDLVYKKMPKEFVEHPRDVFIRNVWVNPFWEEHVSGLIDLIGPDRVVFGSDWPHPEGLAEPVEWVRELKDQTEADQRKIMGGTMYDLLGIKAPAS